jgi:hypothetical protein
MVSNLSIFSVLYVVVIYFEIYNFIHILSPFGCYYSTHLALHARFRSIDVILILCIHV